MAGNDDELAPIIVKKIKKGHGHHGGAWKVAYADFVTAMMAFFLLMWLINMSPPETLEAIATYFDPTNPAVSSAESGAGGVLGGLTMAPQGAMTSTATPIQPPTQATPTTEGARQQRGQNEVREGDTNEDMDSMSATEAAIEQMKDIIREAEEARMEELKEQIEQAIADNPDLAALEDNLLIDLTREGLRIQILDQDGDPMFPSGSARMFEKTRNLMGQVTQIILGVDNDVSIRGHTDASPYGPGATYTNWNLSADRANASRAVIEQYGMPEERIYNVVGKAATDPFIGDDPFDARNRRISIILMREELTRPEEFQRKAEEGARNEGLAEKIEREREERRNRAEDTEDTEEAQQPQRDPNRTYVPSRTPNAPPIGGFQKTPGQIEFP